MIRKSLEKVYDKREKLFLHFVYVEKTFDRVITKLIEWQM